MASSAFRDRRSAILTQVFLPNVGTWLLLLFGILVFTNGVLADGQKTSSATNFCEILTVEGKVIVYLAKLDAWQAAKPGQFLCIGDQLQTDRESRATVRFSNLSVLRVDAMTTFSILPPPQQNKKPLLDLRSGSVYFFSREKPAEILFQTPTASGAIRGTEFDLETLANGETTLSLFDGDVDLGNEIGRIRLRGGERARVLPGQAPVKSAVIDAINVIQWCLYYPGIVDVDELTLPADERDELGESLASYRSGDLLMALATFPTNNPPCSEGGLAYRAALEISVGRVEEATALLSQIKPTAQLGLALQEMVAGVKGQTWRLSFSPSSASQWLAHSYYLQSQRQPEEALVASYTAVKKAPSFGFGWVRVAELELGLGHLEKARFALEKGLQLSPRNTEGISTRGFLLAAQDRTPEALACFEQAINIDGALGNAWLGRGLCRIRRGDVEGGREDLQVAVALEPQRAILRSYLAKAFDHAGYDALAQKELRLAKLIDSNDPTAWLYSALLDQRLARINEAIGDLEKSKELNGNRQLFRSKLLLDQDQAVREANLAEIFADDGMFDLSARESAKAVNNDYGNSSAHLFAAYSYDALRDSNDYVQRYDAAAEAEWLVGNLLAPTGSEALSKNVAARDYSQFFVVDGLGLASSSEYSSRGAWVETASQYGRTGQMAYAIDTFYKTDPGQRSNNDLEKQDYSAQTKMQLSQHDSIFFSAEYLHQTAGDLAQYYNQNSASRTLRVSETQDPSAFFGYHREWEPGIHTLFLFGGVQDTLTVKNPAISPLFFYCTNGVVSWANPPAQPLDENYERSLNAYSGELQQIWENDSHSSIIGGRVQSGREHVISSLQAPLTANIQQNVGADLWRWNIYGYHGWQVLEPLRLTLGAEYDWLEYPVDMAIPPVTGETALKQQISPKVGLIYTPWKGGSLRTQYTRSLGGVDNESTISLQPTTVGGFNQTFRSLFPESVVGPVPASEFETLACGFDQAFSSRTYLSVEVQLLRADADRTVGILTNENFVRIPNMPSTANQQLRYEERSLLWTANQLLGREWAIGVRDQLSQANLDGFFPNVSPNAKGASGLVWDQMATLNQLTFYANFNHPSGYFMQFQSQWITQENEGYTPALANSDFWQHNVFAGYRFFKRHAEVRIGVMNLTDRDYELNPLNIYAELPRARTFVANLKFNF